MKFEKVVYPDGSFYAKMIEAPKKGETTYYTHWINSYEDMWYLGQIKNVLDNYEYDDVVLNIPCLLDAQADRRFHDNESANLKMVCEYINSLGFKNVRVFHPHNPEAVEMALGKVQIVPNRYFVQDVLENIKYLENISWKDMYDNYVLMSTDAGGFKPLMKTADQISWRGEVFAASKSRVWDEEKQKSILTQQVDRQDFGGKNIIIVDDLCVYGGTFVGLLNLLQGKNCGEIYLVVSHITVKNPNKQLEEFAQVYSTTSKYNREDYNLNNLTLFDVESYI